MSVAILQLAERSVDVMSYLRSRALEEPIADVIRVPGVELLLAGGALCTDVIAQPSKSQSRTTPQLGDPTEIALVIAAAELGMFKEELERLMPRVAEVPFTSERKLMTTVHRIACEPSLVPGQIAAAGDGNSISYLVFTKGAVDNLLELSSTVWLD
jgi:Ca2+-transporting ATPase